MSAPAEHARAALEEVCARGDLARARELYANDFVDHVNALDFHGQEGIAKSVALYRTVFPDLEIRLGPRRGLALAARYLAGRLPGSR
jgi:hypothetical protein